MQIPTPEEAAELSGFDVSKVYFPKYPGARAAFIGMIKEAGARGYKKFGSQTLVCLNEVKNVGEDEGVDGWDCLGFVHDCAPEEVENGTYNDVRLFGQK